MTTRTAEHDKPALDAMTHAEYARWHHDRLYAARDRCPECGGPADTGAGHDCEPIDTTPDRCPSCGQDADDHGTREDIGACPVPSPSRLSSAACPGCEWTGYPGHHHRDAEDGPRVTCCDHAPGCADPPPAAVGRPIAAITITAPDATAAAHYVRVWYGWPGDALTVEPFPFGMFHVTLRRKIVR